MLLKNMLSKMRKKLQTFDLNFFLDKIFFGLDGFQNMFVYQPKFNTIDVKQANNEYVSAWNSKGIYSFNLVSLHDLASTIKFFEHKSALKFNNSVLVVQQNNNVTKIVSGYSVYELDNWPRYTTTNLVLKNCLFGQLIIETRVMAIKVSMHIVAME